MPWKQKHIEQDEYYDITVNTNSELHIALCVKSAESGTIGLVRWLGKHTPLHTAMIMYNCIPMTVAANIH